MKTFVIEEKFVGYADITIEAETEEEAIQIYKDGNYKDCNYNLDEYFYEYEFNSIREEKWESLQYQHSLRDTELMMRSWQYQFITLSNLCKVSIAMQETSMSRTNHEYRSRTLP